MAGTAFTSEGDFIAGIDKKVEEYGFTVIGVAAQPSFSYTVGFWKTHQHPEIMVSGVHPDVAHSFMWLVWERVEQGEVFEAGERYQEICAGDYDVEFREIPPPRKPLNVASAYYGGEDFPALQMVFPDKQGVFPGEEGYDVSMPQELADGLWD